MARKLMKGCEALGEAAIRAGALHFFGYPITPQSEVPEYLSRRMPEVGGVYVQAESEVAAVNMLYGAAATGKRVFTSSSSPGISLMAEGMSYLAGSELPVVIINIIRCGPGLGGILPGGCDYLQATKGAGHGDYKCLVFGPSTIQEAADLVIDAFDLADKYRNPVMVIGDGLIGQMMEPVEFLQRPPLELPSKDWITNGAKGRLPNIINSLYLDPNELEEVNLRLQRKYRQMEKEEVRVELYNCDSDYELLLTSWGTTARVCKSVIDALKEEGVEVGMVRPITLYPFPYKELRQAADKAKQIFCVEMSLGQMLEDVKLGVLDREKPIHFYGRVGGIVPSPEEVLQEVRKILRGERTPSV